MESTSSTNILTFIILIIQTFWKIAILYPLIIFCQVLETVFFQIIQVSIVFFWYYISEEGNTYNYKNV